MKDTFNNKKFVSRRGQSLMELLIGMAVGSVLIIGSAAIITSSIQSNGQVTNIQIQAQLGEELLNNVKAWSDGNWNALLALATGTTSTYYMNTASSPFTILPAASTTASSSYTYSRSITVSSNASGTNSNFPMLFQGTYSWLEPVADGGRIQNLTTAPNGSQEPADLVFATSTANCGIANLNFETESYTSSTGAVNDWIDVPSLSAGTVIYACYDNSSVTTDQSHPSSTWNNNFKAVYHLSSPTSTPNYLESTANNYAGASNNSPTTATGQIDGAVGLNGSNQDWYASTALLGSNTSNSGTFYMWADSLSFNGGYLTYQDGNGHNAFAMYFPSASNQPVGWYLGVNTGYNSTKTNFATGTWYLYTLTWNPTASTVNLYINGVLDTSYNDSYYDMGVGASPTCFGAYCYGGSTGQGGYFQGSEDETEISATALSPSWILTEYNNQSSPFTFYSLGSEQSNTGGGGGSSTSTVESVVNNGVTFQRSFYVSDVYRDNNGNVTTTISGNFYDPSTKLVTVSVGVASSSIPPNTYSMYITRNNSNYLDQTTWVGGGNFTSPSIFVSSTYARATNTAVNAQGGFQIAAISGGGANGYTYSRSITVAGSQVSSTETNFPMLISGSYSWLAASSSGGYVQNVNGDDIIFTSDSAGSSPLNWEMESYSSSTGNIVAWVNVPTMNSSTEIYMFYDDPSINTFQGNVTGTWNSNYGLVLHFPTPTSTLSVTDSKGNNNGTNNGATSATGQIDGAAKFIANAGDYDTVAASSSFEATSSISISFWINGTNDSGNQPYFFDTDSDGFAGTTLQNYNNKIYWSLGGSGNNEFAYPYTSDNNWHYFVTTYNGSTMILYIDGTQRATASVSETINWDTNAFTIGDRQVGGSSYAASGTIDEFDINKTALTPSWILTEYNNQSSPGTFSTFGSQATSTGGGSGSATSTLDSQPFDIGSASGGALNSFVWQGVQAGGTTVQFQFAVSNASSGPWNFVGSDGTSNTYYSGNPGTPINLISTTNGYTLFSGYRYFSYRTTISTTGSASSTVSEVTVNWSP